MLRCLQKQLCGYLFFAIMAVVGNAVAASEWLSLNGIQIEHSTYQVSLPEPFGAVTLEIEYQVDAEPNTAKSIIIEFRGKKAPVKAEHIRGLEYLGSPHISFDRHDIDESGELLRFEIGFPYGVPYDVEIPESFEACECARTVTVRPIVIFGVDSQGDITVSRERPMLPATK